MTNISKTDVMNRHQTTIVPYRICRNSNPEDCRYGRETTGEFRNENEITFDHDMASVTNPIRLKLDRWSVSTILVCTHTQQITHPTTHAKPHTYTSSTHPPPTHPTNRPIHPYSPYRSPPHPYSMLLYIQMCE